MFICSKDEILLAFVSVNPKHLNVSECDSQEIIQQLIDNSSTFKDKTEYAQDKYIKKKKKK